MSLASTFDARFLPLAELERFHPTGKEQISTFTPPGLSLPPSEAVCKHLQHCRLSPDKTIRNLNHLLSTISLKVKKLLLNEQGDIAPVIEVDGVSEIAFYGTHGADTDLTEKEYNMFQMALRGPSVSHLDTVKQFLHSFPNYKTPPPPPLTRTYQREARKLHRGEINRLFRKVRNAKHQASRNQERTGLIQPRQAQDMLTRSTAQAQWEKFRSLSDEERVSWIKRLQVKCPLEDQAPKGPGELARRRRKRHLKVKQQEIGLAIEKTGKDLEQLEILDADEEMGDV